jgi:hypothetical protein
VFLPVLLVVGLAIESSGGTLGDWIFVLGTSGTSIGLILLGYRMQADIGTVPAPIA